MYLMSREIYKKGFTIIELLVSVVVIVLLATVTIVSYIGVTSNAVSVSIKSDLTNAYESLKVFKAFNYNYPETISCSIAESDTNTCIELSEGNSVYSYVYDNEVDPQSFTLIIENASYNLKFQITESTKPEQV